jgi:signal transduction histidine kinase
MASRRPLHEDERVSDRLREARHRAEERRDRQARLLRPVGWLLGAVVVIVTVQAHPAPGPHGRGAWVLFALLAYTAMLALALRPGWRNRSVRGQALLDAYLGAAGVALTGLQSRHATGLAPSAAVFAAAAQLPLLPAVVVSAGITVGLDVTLLATRDTGQDVVATTLLCLILAMAAAFLRRAGESQDCTELLYAELQDARDAQAEAAAVAERGRIAGDLHDVLAHSLSGAALQLQGARRLMERDPADPAAASAVTRAAELVKEGLADARRAVGALRGGELPTIDRLPALVEQVRGDLGLDVRLLVEGAPGLELTGEQSLALYRGAQEALTNAARYAPGARVAVTLRHDGPCTTLTVEDSGAGRAPPPLAGAGGGHGLSAMRERIERAGGTMSAGPAGDGWRVRLEVSA